MCGDLCIGSRLVSGFQNAQRFGHVASTVFEPTQTVLNEGIAWRQLDSLQNEFTRFTQANLAIGQ